MKVYCKNCKYCKSYLCSASVRCVRVIKISEEDDHFEHTSTEIHPFMEKDNRNNDCKYYQPKRIFDYIFTIG